MSIVLKSGSTAATADVDTNSQLKVALSNTDAATGKVRVMSENDPGTVTGAPQLYSPETSTDYRLRTGVDSLFDDETFNYVAQNTSKHRLTSTTMTANYSGNSFNTNNSSTLTTTTGVQLVTYRHFPIIGGSSSYAEQTVALSAAMATNTNIDFGFMLQAAAATSIPLDGAYFRWNSGGLFGVVNTNGVEVTTSAFTAFNSIFAIGTFYRMVVTLANGVAQFWINDVLYASISKPIASGSTKLSNTLPWGVRHHNIGVPGSVVQLKVGYYNISVSDYATNRLWASSQSGMGLSAIQGASGQVQGQTANYVNSTVPATVALSNTAANYATLGGQFLFAAPLGAETDYAVFAYLNPVPTTNISGRNLVIRGVWVDSFNTGAIVATTPTVLQWAVSAGATAVSLATAEAANAKAPRRIALGTQAFPVGAAIGADSGKRIVVNFDAPLVVEPGCYAHIIVKIPIGTATASQVIRGVVGFNAYWE